MDFEFGFCFVYMILSTIVRRFEVHSGIAESPDIMLFWDSIYAGFCNILNNNGLA